MSKVTETTTKHNDRDYITRLVGIEVMLHNSRARPGDPNIESSVQHISMAQCRHVDGTHRDKRSTRASQERHSVQTASMRCRTKEHNKPLAVTFQHVWSSCAGHGAPPAALTAQQYQLHLQELHDGRRPARPHTSRATCQSDQEQIYCLAPHGIFPFEARCRRLPSFTSAMRLQAKSQVTGV